MKPINPMQYYYYYIAQQQAKTNEMVIVDMSNVDMSNSNVNVNTNIGSSSVSTFSNTNIKHTIKKYDDIDEDDVPLGVLMHTKLKKNQKTLIDVNDNGVKKTQMKIWNEQWDRNIVKHKKERRREMAVVNGNVICNPIKNYKI